MTGNAYDKYKNNSVMTASGPELTLMLYNGAIKFCNLAIKGIEENNIQESNNNIVKVQKIVEEFINTLDMKYEVANNLELMYDYILRRLREANIDKDKAILEEVLGYLRELRDTWKEAMKLSKQERKISS
jgi:flagellar protein FliS